MNGSLIPTIYALPLAIAALKTKRPILPNPLIPNLTPDISMKIFYLFIYLLKLLVNNFRHIYNELNNIIIRIII